MCKIQTSTLLSLCTIHNCKAFVPTTGLATNLCEFIEQLTAMKMFSLDSHVTNDFRHYLLRSSRNTCSTQCTYLSAIPLYLNKLCQMLLLNCPLYFAKIYKFEYIKFGRLLQMSMVVFHQVECFSYSTYNVCINGLYVYVPNIQQSKTVCLLHSSYCINQ